MNCFAEKWAKKSIKRISRQGKRRRWREMIAIMSTKDEQHNDTIGWHKWSRQDATLFACWWALSPSNPHSNEKFSWSDKVFFFNENKQTQIVSAFVIRSKIGVRKNGTSEHPTVHASLEASVDLLKHSPESRESRQRNFHLEPMKSSENRWKFHISRVISLRQLSSPARHVNT